MSALGSACASASAERGLVDLLPEPLTEDNVSPEVTRPPLVSIIIPCYNGAAYLAEAVLSALAQSYPAVEVLVVDDGSTDTSPEIAQRFPAVRYIRQVNRGLSGARNRGIQECNGAYILFLDADDRLKPRAIESGLRAMERHPDCAFAVGDHVFISGDGSYLSPSKKVATLHSHYEALLTSNFIEMISSVLFRRSIFDELGGFDRNLSVAEDYELYLRIARVRPVCSHTAVVAEYRKHTENMSHNSELMLTTTLRVLSGQEKFVAGDARRRGVTYGSPILANTVRPPTCLRVGNLFFHHGRGPTAAQASSPRYQLSPGLADAVFVTCTTITEPPPAHSEFPAADCFQGSPRRHAPPVAHQQCACHSEGSRAKPDQAVEVMLRYQREPAEAQMSASTTSCLMPMQVLRLIMNTSYD